VGTVVYAVAIGPLVQFFLPYVAVDLGTDVRPASGVHEDPEPLEAGCR
jgi:uncharacterized membrane protein YczE